MRSALGALAGLAVFGLGLLLGFLTESSESPPLLVESLPPRPEALRGVLQQVSGDQFTVSTAQGTVTVRLVDATVYESLRPAGGAALAPGAWLNAGGVPHDQTLFALTGLVIIPAATLQ
jgi:hypothetical protein